MRGIEGDPQTASAVWVSFHCRRPVPIGRGRAFPWYEGSAAKPVTVLEASLPSKPSCGTGGRLRMAGLKEVTAETCFRCHENAHGEAVRLGRGLESC